jgi:hypothetical protein
MTQATVDWGLVYQEYSDPADVAAAVQALAESIDDAVTLIDTDLAAGQQQPGVIVGSFALQPIPNGGVDTVLSFAGGGPQYDNNLMYVPGTPTRLTFNRTGVFVICGQAGWFSAGSAVGSKSVIIKHNVAGTIAEDNLQAFAASGLEDCVSVIYPITAIGQYVELYVSQTTAGVQNIGTARMFAGRLSTL